MQSIRLGRSGIIAKRLGFGALPIQRTSPDDSLKLLHRAIDNEVNFFDTARMYSDSEEKLGKAFYDIRQRVVIATKTIAKDPEGIDRDLTDSLAALRTDYIDIYQFHNAKDVPRPGDGSGRYEKFLKLKQEGIIRVIGITSHSLDVAFDAVESGLYETVQFPFSLLATDREHDLVKACEHADVGFIAMKGLAGGLITHIPAAFSYIAKFANVLPIWGMQNMDELDDFLRLEAEPPAWSNAMEEAARKEREALKGTFCRSCGYCLPCPQDIHIPNIARLNRLLRRTPWRHFTTPEWKEKIATAKSCIHCGDCASRCPYQLDPAALVAENVIDYEEFMRAHAAE